MNLYTVLSVGDLSVGDTFLLKKNGNGYTVHDKVISNKSEDLDYKAMFYIIAVCNGKFFVFDYERRVIAYTH